MPLSRFARGCRTACAKGATAPRLSHLAALAALAPGVALAQGPTTTKSPAGVAEAQDEFNAALRSLEAGGEADCVTLCRALASLARATERLCNLTRGEPEPTVRRCTDARDKLADATKRVHAACPECALAGQTPPSVSAPPSPPPPPEEPKPSPGRELQLTPASTPVSYEESLDVAFMKRGPHLTVGAGLLRLSLPPTFFRVYGEIAPVNFASAVVSVGAGNLPVKPDGRAGVFAVELQPRFYALGGAGRGGVFLGGSVMVASATGSKAIGKPGEKAFDAPLLAAGVSAGPIVGLKHVFRSGLTLEGYSGVNIVGSKPSSERRVVPNIDLSVGWTF